MPQLDDNFLLINKPAGWTSFDAVNFVRKKYKPAKIRVGHAGTLDPFATGLLIVGVGREATRRLDEFKKLPKTYVATLHLGATSDTGDPTGEITPSSVIPTESRDERRNPLAFADTHGSRDSSTSSLWDSAQNDKPTIDEIKNTLKKFIGQQEQTPPMFSAKKINGQRLYTLARRGQTVERKPAQIEIYQIKLLSYAWPCLKIEVACSAGTYLRVLAQDIGQALGTEAYCAELTRAAIGPYTLKTAKNPQEIGS